MAFFGESSGSYQQGKSSETGSSTTTSSSTTKQGTQQGNATMASLMSSLESLFQGSTTFDRFGRNQAIADSQGAMNQAIQQVLQSGIGGVNSGMLTSGGYNSTTQQLLSDNLAAQAAGVGAGVQLEAITNYENLGQQETQTILSSLLSTLGLDQSSLSNTESTSTTNYSKSGKSSGFGLSSKGGWK